jgi:hypothetical protein
VNIIKSLNLPSYFGKFDPFYVSKKGKNMKNSLFLVVTLMLAFTVPVNAGYVQTDEFSVNFSDNSANLLIDLNDWSEYLTGEAKVSAHIDFTAAVESRLSFYNGGDETYEGISGNHFADIEGKFSVSEFLGSSIGSESVNVDAQYQFSQNTLSAGEKISSDWVQNSINVTWDIDNILPLLNENSLSLLFQATEFKGTYGGPLNNGNNDLFVNVRLSEFSSATVRLSIETPTSFSATPEPATFLMFGAAIVIGIPVVRRLRQKEKN